MQGSVAWRRRRESSIWIGEWMGSAKATTDSTTCNSFEYESGGGRTASHWALR